MHRKHRISFHLLCLFLVLATACEVKGQLISEELKANVSARVDQVEFPGIVIAVFDSKNTEYFSHGKTLIGGDTEVDEQTIFEIGSITKTFTAILLADQVLKGAMSLDDPIGRYLPEEVNTPDRDGREITLRHLITHTSGLPRMPSNFAPANPMNPYADYSVEQLYEFLDGYALSRDPGRSYLYSNYGMGLLGNLLERHKSLGYEALLEQVIAGPLDMDDTVLQLNEEQKERFARGHRGALPVSQWDIPTLAGAGAIRSTTEDLVLFIKANIGLIDTELKEAMELSHQKVITTTRKERDLAMAWIYMNDDPEILWHNGGTGGFRSFAGFNKKTGMGVVVLSNSTAGVDDIGFHVLDNRSPLKEVD